MNSQSFSSSSFGESQEKRKQYEEEEKRAMSSGDDDSSYKVELYVYDMTKGIAKQMSPALLGKQIEGIWHTGIVAYGREYFFGSAGIQSVPPGGTLLGEPDRVEDLGCSQVPYQLFLEYIFGLGESNYKPGAYDLLKHNCNNFSEEVSEFLCGRGIPKSILSLPDEVLNTPLGRMLAPMLTSFQMTSQDPLGQMGQGGGSSSKDLGGILAPLAKTLQLKSADSLNIPLGGAYSVINSYVPQEIRSHKVDPEFEELNSAIEEVRHTTQLLESRRNNLNDKLLKKEKKEKKKGRKDKKRKKNRSQSDLLEEKEEISRFPRKRGDSVHFAVEPQVLSHGEDRQRRLSVPVGISLNGSLSNSHQSPPKSILRNHLSVSPLPSRSKPSHSVDFATGSLSHHSNLTELSSSVRRRMEADGTEISPTGEAGPDSVDLEASSLEGGSTEGAEAEVPREPPIIFKNDVDAVGDFDGFVNCVAEKLTPEEQKHMEELRAYVVEDEGSWSLGEDFNKLFTRVFNDTSIPSEAQKHLVRIMAGAALKDDVILMLHQDRKEHTIMNFANRIESLTGEVQEALALFFCNMFEHLSPSEWLLYISEWSEGSQPISNIRVTTKVSVNALLNSNPKIVDYGTALMYNLGTKEVKTVVFDDVAPELAMAILQFLSTGPSEEHIWRVLTALCRFCYSSSEVPTLIQMIGPDPSTFKGRSERIDQVVEEIKVKLSRSRGAF